MFRLFVAVILCLIGNSLVQANAADNNVSPPVPTVSGLSQVVGPLDGGAVVTITGTHFTGATAVKFGNTPATRFKVVSATLITATQPAGSVAGVYVTVTTPGGTSAPSAADQFNYAVAPTVSGVSPARGPIAGGTSVTIWGTNFVGVTAVKFGNVKAAGFTVRSAAEITATPPADHAGTVDVTVTTYTASSTSVNDQFTYAAVPVVKAVSPQYGATAGGTAVTLTGTNLSNATAVNFGLIPGTITANSPTSITVTAPAGSAGAVDVTVVTPGGTSHNQTYTRR